MTSEQTLQKAIEIAKNNWRYGEWEYRYSKRREKFQFRYKTECWCGWCAVTLSDEEILFDRSFREALVGKNLVYPSAEEFSTTRNIRYRGQLESSIEIEMLISDYHLMMCAKSDNRIGYIQSVLDVLENK